MEVHQHTRTPLRKWTHYLFEFLMLFLAVFCGFLAENQREHYIEQKREKKYIQNLLHDLARDTINYNSTIAIRLEREKQAFQLVSLLYSPDRNKHLGELYYLARQMPRMNTIFFPTDATMNQLKNSGALRLIKKTNIADSIVAYNAAVEGFAVTQQTEITVRNLFRDEVGNVFDATVFLSMIDSSAQNLDQIVIPPSLIVIPPAFIKPLVTENRQTINHLCMLVQFLYSASIIGRNISLKHKKQAIRLIELLKKEYRLG